MILKSHGYMKGALSMALLAMLLIGNLQSLPVPLSPADLSRSRGGSIWNDPCTWDGFVAGASATFCGIFLAGGFCFGALVTVEKARTLDKCFG